VTEFPGGDGWDPRQATPEVINCAAKTISPGGRKYLSSPLWRSYVKKCVYWSTIGGVIVCAWLTGSTYRISGRGGYLDEEC